MFWGEKTPRVSLSPNHVLHKKPIKKKSMRLATLLRAKFRLKAEEAQENTLQVK